MPPLSACLGLSGFSKRRKISVGRTCLNIRVLAILVGAMATRPSGGPGGEMNEQPTATAAIETIWARKNRRRTIWTATILLERIGIARHSNTPAAFHKQAARILRELWRTGKLVRRVALNREGHLLEAAYMRPEDKLSLYFEACDKCGFPRLARYGRAESCRRCAGEQIDENRYYAQSPEQTQSTYPIFTEPPARPGR
jgi:predicted Zn-ribbon and HTH transcriptional regulator